LSRGQVGMKEKIRENGKEVRITGGLK